MNGGAMVGYAGRSIDSVVGGQKYAQIVEKVRGLTPKQLAHLGAICLYRLEEWLDGRVVKTLRRRELITWSLVQERWVPAPGVVTAYMAVTWKGETENGYCEGVGQADSIPSGAGGGGGGSVASPDAISSPLLD